MFEDLTMEELFVIILKDFFDNFNISDPVIPDFRIVSDIAKTYQEIRPEILENSSKSLEELNEYNGFTIPPKIIDGKFIVLLNLNVILENQRNHRLDWIGTIVHETTHVQDFIEYARIISAPNYELLLNIGEHGMFDIWTEINARAKGYYFVRKYTLGEAINSKKMLSDIMEREIPLQWKMLFEKYNATDNGFQQAYLVAHYVGRLHTLQQLYPVEISDDWIRNHFMGNKWMSELFFFYKNYNNIYEAADHFDEMKDILRENFKGL